MHRAGLVRLVRMGLVYLLVAAAAALGWLWHALPEEICLEPGQMLQLPRFAWVEPLRGRGAPSVRWSPSARRWPCAERPSGSRCSRKAPSWWDFRM